MAALSDKISWYIDLNASSALRGFKDVADAADKQLGAASKRIKDFEKSGKTSNLDGLAGKANGALSKLGVQAELTGAQLQGGLATAAAAAGTAIVAFAASSVKAYQDLAQEVIKVQRVTGTTAQDSSRLVQVLDDYQVSGEAAATSFSKLNKALAAGTLAKFGIDAAKNADGTTDFVASLGRVADAYNRTKDPAARAALGTAAFGKSYQALIPIIEQGGAKLAESLKGVDGKLILDQSAVDRAEKLRLSMDNLGDTITGLKLAVAEGLIGPLANAIESVTLLIIGLERAKEFADGGAFKIGPFDVSVKGLAEGLNPLNRINRDVKVLSDLLGIAGDDAKDAGSKVASAGSDIGAAAAVIDDAASKVDKLGSSFDKLADVGSLASKAVADSAAASARLDAANKGLDAANQARTKAVDEYTASVDKLQRVRADAPGRIEAAERAYASALRASAEAADRVTDAQTKLARARKESSTGLTAAKAELAVLDAQQRLSLAQERASVRRSPLDDQQAKVDALQAQIDLEDAVAARNNLAAGKDPNIIGAQRDAADAASAKADADADAGEARKNIERTRQDVEKSIADAKSAVDETWADFEKTGVDVTNALAEQLAAAADAMKTPAERYKQYLIDAINQQNEALTNAQILKDRGFGALADQLAAMGPEGFAIMDSFVDASDIKLAGINDLLAVVAGNAERARAQLAGLTDTSGPSITLPGFGGTKSFNLPPLPSGGVAPVSSGPVYNNTFNISGEGKSVEQLAEELAYALAFIGAS